MLGLNALANSLAQNLLNSLVSDCHSIVYFTCLIFWDGADGAT